MMSQVNTVHRFNMVEKGKGAPRFLIQYPAAVRFAEGGKRYAQSKDSRGLSPRGRSIYQG